MDADDWRAQLHPSFRQRKVDEIMSALKTHYPDGDQDKLFEIEKVSQSFEHKAFAGATSQAVYLERIRLMIFSIKEQYGWRAQLQPDSRARIVNKIMDTLKRHLPFSGPEGMNELRKIARRFEDKIYTAATSQTDYLRKISFKMLAMETKSQTDTTTLQPTQQPTELEEQPKEATEELGQGKRAKRIPEWNKDFYMGSIQTSKRGEAGINRNASTQHARDYDVVIPCYSQIRPELAKARGAASGS